MSLASRPVSELPAWHGCVTMTMSLNLYDNQQLQTVPTCQLPCQTLRVSDPVSPALTQQPLQPYTTYLHQVLASDSQHAGSTKLTSSVHCWISAVSLIQCFDTVGWVSGRTSSSQVLFQNSWRKRTEGGNGEHDSMENDNKNVGGGQCGHYTQHVHNMNSHTRT